MIRLMVIPWKALLSERMTYRNGAMGRAPLNNITVKDNTMMLTWQECGCNCSDRLIASHSETIRAPHFLEGLTGLWLRGVSYFELTAMRKIICSGIDAILIRDRSHQGFTWVAGYPVRSNEYEAWFRHDEDAVRFHHMLESLPVRSHLELSKLPMEPVVVSMLLKQNSYWCKSLVFDGYMRDPAALISVQDFDQVGTLLAMLKLTM